MMTSATAEQLTVVIPTYNRSRFLARLLAYARGVAFPFPMVIADSSSGEERLRNEEQVAALRGILSIQYRHFETGFVEKLWSAVEGVTTPYCCFWADDDFQIPAGIAACMAFLEANTDYESSMGQFLGVGGSRGGTHAALETYPSRDEVLASDRILRWSENFYSGFYAVHRTPALQKMVRVTAEASCYERSRIIPEILIGQMALLLGPQRMIPGISIVYQMHPGNDSRVTPGVRDNRAFPADYQRYLSVVAPMVAAHAKIPLDEARGLVDRSFRNIYCWKGGPAWLFKKMGGNVVKRARRIHRWWDSRRAQPRLSHFTVDPVPSGDPILQTDGVAAAMDWITRHPNGIQRGA
jgi:glycosyltransferase domain-containing protein